MRDDVTNVLKFKMKKLLLSFRILGYLILYLTEIFMTSSFCYEFFHHTTCESTCDTLSSSAANQGDNNVSVAQGGTTTPGAIKQLLPPDRVFKRNIYIYINTLSGGRSCLVVPGVVVPP